MQDILGHILVIDADVTQAMLIKAWLQGRGFAVTTHSGGPDWRASLKAEFEAVICDDALPHVPPERLLEAWQEINPHGFVILLGKSLLPERILHLMAQGAFTYLPKPVLEEQLVQALSQGRQNRRVLLDILQLSDELTQAYLQLQEQAARLQQKQARQQEQAAELNFINGFSYALTTTLHPGKLAAIIARELSHLASFSFFGLDWFLNPDERRIFVSPGLDYQGQQALLQQTGGKDEIAPAPSERRPEFQVVPWRSEQAVHHRLPAYRRIFPLEIAGKTVGVLTLGHDRPLSLSPGKMKLMRALGPYMALAMKNAMEHHELRHMAEVDALTEVLNRRMFEYHLKREVFTSRRYDYPVSLMLLDVDLFKQINDAHGHRVGDAVLKRIAELLRQESRQSDVVARYGGDEFVLIMPHTTAKKAKIMGKRFLKKLAQERFANGSRLRVTVSVGIANNQLDNLMDENDLIFAADRALYLAKERGRNNLVVLDKPKLAGESPHRERSRETLHDVKLSTPA